jgi:hypothetical protein
MHNVTERVHKMRIRQKEEPKLKSQVADGEDGLQMWRVAANIPNKQSRTADKGWSSSLGVGRGANNSSPQKISLLRNVRLGLGLGWILWINYLS